MFGWFKRYFRQRRVFNTFDGAKMASACMALRQADIQFKTEERSDDISAPAYGMNNLPRVLQAATEYSLYVDKDDVELAEYLLNGGRLD